MQGSDKRNGKSFQDLLAILLGSAPGDQTTTVVEIARKKSPEYAVKYLSQEVRNRLEAFGEDHVAASELRIQGLFSDLAEVLLLAVRAEGAATRDALAPIVALLNNQADHSIRVATMIEQVQRRQMGPIKGWSYELANSMQGAVYSNWKTYISFDKPNVPDGSIRNLRALYAGQQT